MRNTAFNLRLPPLLKAQLEQSAKENERSLNQEIIWRLRASLEGYRR
jgi:predicted HicB family RNase H-like nuclease